MNSEGNPEVNSGEKPIAEGTDIDWAEYAHVVSRAQGYQLDDAQLARVTAQLALINAVAAPLLALQLPAVLEPAPVFRP